MANALDHQVGWVLETTYNTPVTVTRFGEWMPGSGIDWDPNVAQGRGLRVGAAVARSARRVGLVGSGSGKLQFELASKGFGTLLQAAWGTATSTLVGGTGTTYQQVFTPVATNGYLPSLTVQEGIVLAGGTVHAYTYGGVSVSKFEIDMPSSGLCTASFDLDARSLATATSLATASYPTSPTLYHSALPTTGAMAANGTLTVLTTTALGSMASGTASVAIKSWKLAVDNGLDVNRNTLGGRNQPSVGLRSIKLTTEVEYDATTAATFRDALINQTSMAILLTANTAEALSTGTATLQVAVPAAWIDTGAIPQPTDGSTATTSLEWSCLETTTSAAYMVLRTADTAL